MSSSAALSQPYGAAESRPSTLHQSVTPAPSTEFQWPAYTSFPPFYTLQPNTTTLTRQLELWSSLVLSYCSHPTHKIYRLSITSSPPDLFSNRTLARSLKPTDIRIILTHMSTPAGGQTIELLPPASKGEQSGSVYVWWKSAGEWADLVYAWVDSTGQKGAVLTVYELREGEGGREWVGMDEGMLMKTLGVW